ncbi:MAG TPA: hypothetical protein VFP07_01960 [Buchnera sp. (in: enterobacteria)]|nr:hypothetical protein [Buchnera sp. (in: enterobacteria)]
MEKINYVRFFFTIFFISSLFLVILIVFNNNVNDSSITSAELNSLEKMIYRNNTSNHFLMITIAILAVMFFISSLFLCRIITHHETNSLLSNSANKKNVF